MANRREFARMSVAAGLAATTSTFVRAAGPAMAPDPYLAVNPQFREILRARFTGPAIAFSRETYKAARARIGSFAPPPHTTPAFVMRDIPGQDGRAAVPVLVVGASPGGSKPAILYIHGGGFVAGTALGSIASAQTMAQDLDCIVVVVDYRLAPETPYPGPLDDCHAALVWLHDKAADLGVDPRRIAVHGESAGGGLAAMLVLAARDRGGPSICHQSLIYPMLDDRTAAPDYRLKHSAPLVWTVESNRFGWEAFLGQAPGGPDVPKGSVPARMETLENLPSTFIGVGSIDLFADEDIAYARRLVQAGNAKQLLVIPGGFHGFDSFVPQAPLSQAFRAAWVSALRDAFASG